MVKKGQFLLQIDPATYQADVQREAAGVASARRRPRARQGESRAVAERVSAARTEIVKTNPALISAEQIEQLKTTVDVNDALYQAAHAHGRPDERGAAATRSRAWRRRPSSHRWTAASRGSRCSRARPPCPARSTRMRRSCSRSATCRCSRRKVKVDETDVARLHVGDTAQVLIDAFPDTTFRGKVTEIAHSSVQRPRQPPRRSSDQAVDYEVRVQLLDPPLDTRPDFSATAKIVWDSRKSVLSIPIIALTVREHRGERESRLRRGRPRQEGDEGHRAEGCRGRVRGRARTTASPSAP